MYHAACELARIEDVASARDTLLVSGHLAGELAHRRS